MQVVILGASGAIGRLVVSAAVARGWGVRAVVRPGTQHPDLAALHGVAVTPVDLEDRDALVVGLRNADAVVDCLAASTNTPEAAAWLRATTARLLEAMAEAGLSRIVLLSGAGVRVPGERRSGPDRLMAVIVRRLARHVVAAKQAEYELTAASEALWTAVRPPFVSDGPRVGYVLSEASPPLRRGVSRADVADALLDVLAMPEWTRKAPFVASRG
jgi:putative NADH-flavin reductase